MDFRRLPLFEHTATFIAVLLGFLGCLLLSGLVGWCLHRDYAIRSDFADRSAKVPVDPRPAPDPTPLEPGMEVEWLWPDCRIEAHVREVTEQGVRLSLRVPFGEHAGYWYEVQGWHDPSGLRRRR